MTTPTEARDRASELARTDPEAAAALARGITDPFCRCQALGWVARYAPADDALDFAKAAMDAAGDCDDAYQQVVASAWPIRALFETGKRDDALLFLELSLGAVPRIEAPSSRAEALAQLLQAGFEAGEDFRRSIAFALAELADSDQHWRVHRALRDTLAMIAPADREFAEKLARSHGDRDAGRLLEAVRGQPQEPRSYFW
ncbi:MAG: hypothetical protein NXI31_20660 [bacterium]|nr:hypothetical protein [bacterium]